MLGVPQRGRRSDAPVSRLSVPIDGELKHELKQAALDDRVTVTEYVTRLIETAVSGPERAAGSTAAARIGDDARLDMNIDPELHRRFKRAALAQDVTVSQYLTRLVEAAVRGAGGTEGAGEHHRAISG